MPQIELFLPTGALTDAARDGLVEQLTALLLRREGAPDTPEARSISWCFVHEFEPGRLHVAGRPVTEPHYRVVLTVPEGAAGITGPLLRANRAELVREATEAVLEAERTPYSSAAARRVWIQIAEIPNGFWGGYGELVDIADVATYVGVQLPEPTERGLRLREAFRAQPVTP